MQYLTLPFFDKLQRAQHILLAGAGGGYDIFCGLPLYFGLRAAGKQVHLANLSFSFLPFNSEQRLSPSMQSVTTQTPMLTDYFPEWFLCQWFETIRKEEVPIYCFHGMGVKPLVKNYQLLINKLSLDTIILIDGGTDSLMRGDEFGLATPDEDISHIAAVHELEVQQKMLTCLGFGVDYFHGICHAHFLEGVAELTKSGGYLGMFSLVKEMPEVQKYQEAVEFVFQAMPKHMSIVSSSIVSALAGCYGNHHATPRTSGSRLWINPFMPVYWCFQLEKVAQRILYLEAMKNTETYQEVRLVIRNFRNRCHSIRKWETIPV